MGRQTPWYTQSSLQDQAEAETSPGTSQCHSASPCPRAASPTRFTGFTWRHFLAKSLAHESPSQGRRFTMGAFRRLMQNGEDLGLH